MAAFGQGTGKQVSGRNLLMKDKRSLSWMTVDKPNRGG
jgi:hypothetical protein